MTLSEIARTVVSASLRSEAVGILRLGVPGVAPAGRPGSLV